MFSECQGLPRIPLGKLSLTEKQPLLSVINSTMTPALLYIHVIIVALQ